jgi:hypothetical protein
MNMYTALYIITTAKHNASTHDCTYNAITAPTAAPAAAATSNRKPTRTFAVPFLTTDDAPMVDIATIATRLTATASTAGIL